MDFSGKTIQAAVDAAQASGIAEMRGTNASYIPYLAKIPSHLFGIAVMTADGRLFKAGDTDYAFAIESISKIFTLALVIELIGSNAVREKVGVSPTGLPFNSVMALELHNGKPLSPLVNAGAIATVSLVPGDTADECWGKILDMQSRFAGRPIALSDEVNRSEQTTNFHNRAIGWLLCSAETCYSDPMRAVDVYTRQCSTLVTTIDLATMGATLRVGWREPGDETAGPRSGERPARACRNGHGRPLHGIRGMGLLGRLARQERRRRRHFDCVARQARHRRLLTASRSSRQ